MQVTCRSHTGIIYYMIGRVITCKSCAGLMTPPPAGTCLLHHADGCSREQSLHTDLPQYRHGGRERVRVRVLQAALPVPGRPLHRPPEGPVPSPPELLDEGEYPTDPRHQSACT